MLTYEPGGQWWGVNQTMIDPFINDIPLKKTSIAITVPLTGLKQI